MSQTILRIDSSIKGDQSFSRQLTDGIIARLVNSDPDATIVTRNLASPAIPEIDGAWLGAVFTPEGDRSPEQAATAALSDTLIAEIKAADVVVIGLPVYNFGVPAGLKSWVDHLSRAGVTFSYTENGPVGLIEGTKAIVAMTSGGTKMGSGIDFASPYLRHVLGFIGITDVQFVAADRLASDAEGSMKTAQEAVANLSTAA